MTFFILRVYIKILGACWSTLGVGKEFLLFISLRPLLFFFNHVTLFLDNIFFPGYRGIDIEKPVFMIGHPRSGTTFLHRLLSQSREFAVFEFWETLFPSLIARKIAAPFIKSEIKRGKEVIFSKEVGHEIALRSIEEEELLFLHNLNTQFISVSTPLGFGDWNYKDLVYSDKQPDNIRKKTMKFFWQCLQRQIYYSGKKQIFANMNYSGLRIKSLFDTFPDAKIIYLMRSPYETIPSHLSLDLNVIDRTYGINNIDSEKLQLYFERRYRYDVEYYKYIEALIDQNTFDAAQFMVILYDMIKDDLEKLIQLILEFTELKISKELEREIQQQIQNQGSYRRKHLNLELEDFGLSKAKVLHDLGFIFDKYGFDK